GGRFESGRGPPGEDAALRARRHPRGLDPGSDGGPCGRLPRADGRRVPASGDVRARATGRARRLRRSDSHRRGFARLTDQGAMTQLARTPIFSISASTRSPALRNLPSAAPTPSGVPVAMTSPGKSVKPCESTAMLSSTGKIIFEVWLDWRVSLFTRSEIGRAHV